MDTAGRLSDFIREFEAADREVQERIAAAATDPRERKQKDLADTSARETVHLRRPESPSESIAHALEKQAETFRGLQEFIKEALGAMNVRIAENVQYALTISPELTEALRRMQEPMKVLQERMQEQEKALQDAMAPVQWMQEQREAFQQSIFGRLHAAGVSSITELLRTLIAAGFPDARAWTISDFERLVDAGVFEGNPSPEELGQRIRKVQEAKEMERLLNTKEAAALLGIPYSTLHSRIRLCRERGEAHPFVKVETVARGRFIVNERALLSWSRQWEQRTSP